MDPSGLTETATYMPGFWDGDTWIPSVWIYTNDGTPDSNSGGGGTNPPPDTNYPSGSGTGDAPGGSDAPPPWINTNPPPAPTPPPATTPPPKQGGGGSSVPPKTNVLNGPGGTSTPMTADQITAEQTAIAAELQASLPKRTPIQATAKTIPIPVVPQPHYKGGNGLHNTDFTGDPTGANHRISMPPGALLQTNSSLTTDMNYWGCYVRSLMAAAECYTGRILRADQINAIVSELQGRGMTGMNVDNPGL